MFKNGKPLSPEEAGPAYSSCTIPRVDIPLYSKMRVDASTGERVSLVQKLSLPGSDDIDEAVPSAQSVDRGEKFHPFDMDSVNGLMVANTHHSACILCKRDAMTGLGFKSDRVSEKLDPLTMGSFLDLLNMIGEDFWQVGNGYMEVVREKNGTIVGLHHIPAAQVSVFLENPVTYDFHYIIRAREGSERRFARFGDRSAMMKRNGLKLHVSEVIHFRQPSALSRYYGVPNWLSAVASIELVMAILQHNFDFFNNRGVPEFILFLLGGTVAKPDFDKIQEGLKAQIGVGNSHKSMVVNLHQTGIEAQLEKLNVDGGNTEASFQAFLDTLSLMIVSAHRVPPLLAGIQIPGKLGANNELPNALAGFQALVIGPAQQTFAHTLGTSLGHPKLGVREGIRGRKSFEFNTILEEINVAEMAAVASTRTPVGPSASAMGGKPKPATAAKPKPQASASTVKKLKARFAQSKKSLDKVVKDVAELRAKRSA